MAKRNTSIQINGKRYDALSGALMTFEEIPVKPKPKSIDGVVGGKSAKHTVTPKVVATAVKPTTAAVAPSKPKAKPARAAAKHATAKHVEPSKTLMRHAVKKPKPSVKRRVKVQTATHSSVHIASTAHIVVKPKTSLHRINHERAKRASQHVTSPRVSHFSQEVQALTATVRADVKQAVTAIDRAIVIPQTVMPAGGYRPDIRRVKVASNNQTSDIFEQALLRATSHDQPPVELPKGRRGRALRRRMVSFTAGAVAVLAIVGFFGYQKQDAIQFKVAARQASFSATMPGYQPTGYSLDKVQVAGDTVHVKYANADKNYVVSERPTTWGSQTLLEKIALNQPANTYASVNADGRTVYLFGRNQAAWVHNGVLYQVLGNGVLSAQDFTQIASSM